MIDDQDRAFVYIFSILEIRYVSCSLLMAALIDRILLDRPFIAVLVGVVQAASSEAVRPYSHIN